MDFWRGVIIRILQYPFVIEKYTTEHNSLSSKENYYYCDDQMGRCCEMVCPSVVAFVHLWIVRQNARSNESRDWQWMSVW